MGLWEMIALIVVAGIIGEIIKTYTKRHASRKELIEIRDTLNALQQDVDEIKTNIANIVIQFLSCFYTHSESYCKNKTSIG